MFSFHISLCCRSAKIRTNYWVSFHPIIENLLTNEIKKMSQLKVRVSVVLVKQICVFKWVPLIFPGKCNNEGKVQIGHVLKAENVLKYFQFSVFHPVRHQTVTDHLCRGDIEVFCTCKDINRSVEKQIFKFSVFIPKRFPQCLVNVR